MDFKMRVTPQESCVAQLILGKHLKEVMWKCIDHYLYYEEDNLFVGFCPFVFRKDLLPEISFFEFSEKFDDCVIEYNFERL